MNPDQEMYTEVYADIKKLNPPSLRSRARHMVLDALSFLKRHSFEEALGTPRVQFLYIHHIFRDEEESLRQLLKTLSRQHRFISHSEACSRVLNGEIDRPYISISSDDGFKNNVRAAAIFKEFDISACFFICPGMIGVQSEEKVTQFCRERLHLTPVEFMDWHDIDHLLKEGHEIGSHTMNHMRISDCSSSALVEEVGRSYELVKAHCGSANHFAYPYGRFNDFSEAGRKLVFDSGHRTCASAERGCVLKPATGLEREQVLLRRDHVILDWPMSHVLYFLVRNLANPSLQSLTYPPYEADYSHK